MIYLYMDVFLFPYAKYITCLPFYDDILIFIPYTCMDVLINVYSLAAGPLKHPEESPVI